MTVAEHARLVEPVETKTVRLGDVVSVIMGQAPAGDTYNTDNVGTPLIAGAGDFSGGNLTPKKYTTKPSKLSIAGDIVLSIRASIGDKVWSNGEYCLGRGVAALRTSEGVDKDFLWHWVTHSEPALRAKAKGATFLQVNRSDIAELPMSLPPLPKQRRIAAILDKADHLRAQRREALAHLDALTQSIFDDMFGDPVTNELGWPKQPMSALLSSIESGRSPVCLARPATDGEWGILKLGAISTQSWLPAHNKALAESEANPRFEVKAGDVLFSRKNTPDLVAAVCLVNRTPPRLLLPDLIFRLCIKDPSTIVNVYLASVLQHANQRGEVQSLASGSAQSMVNISKAKVMTVTIPVPPLELQQTFARRVAGVERLKEQHRAQLAELDTFFASLQHRAFRGEL